MAENKPGFILYNDQKDLFLELKDNEAGALIKHIFRYTNDENPELSNRNLKIVFSLIKSQLKRDLKKYEATKKRKSDAGALGNLKRWNPDLFDKVISGEIELTEAVNIAEYRKVSLSDKNIANVAVTDTVNVTVNVTDTVTDISIGDKKENLLEQWFIDLKTGNQINEIARTSKTPVQYFKDRIEPFRKAANIEYPSHRDFLNHFKRWSLLNRTIGQESQGSFIKLGRK